MKCAYIILLRMVWQDMKEEGFWGFLRTLNNKVQMYKGEGQIRGSEFKATKYSCI